MILKKITAVIMSAVLAVGASVSAYAAIDRTTVSFSYPDGAFDHEQMNASVVYSDSYFTGKSTKKNDSLALLSMAASAAVYDKDDIKDFLRDCGFTNKRDSVTDDSSDNLSFNLGKKKIGKKTVVAVILQGTASRAEWKSNLNLGIGSTIHKGFNTTEKAVHSELNAFIKKNKLKKGSTIFWVTGHSRGAAVADIMAKRLSDKYGKASVFAYTFASPKVALVSEKSAKSYNNIYNYVNPDDIVTQIPPKDSKTLEQQLVTLGVVSESTLNKTFGALGLSSAINYEFGQYVRFGQDVSMSADEHDSMAEAFADITGVEFDETSVEHNHCQSCYLAWLMP